MVKVWIYTVAACHNPDKVVCQVPCAIDERQIFFGPCKKLIRERLREDLLSSNKVNGMNDHELYIVGINGGSKVKKIIWAGKLLEGMTFAKADQTFQGEKYSDLRNHRCSPLHVRPIMRNGTLKGYEHVSEEHIEDNAWVSDLVSHRAIHKSMLEGRKLLLLEGTPWEAFDRDFCMRLENIFFAKGQGIAFDEVSLQILRKGQPGKIGIDQYAIFGRTESGKVNGLRGTFREIEGDDARDFIKWICSQSRSMHKNN